MQWFNPQSEPFKIYGFPFYAQEKVYRRMPLSATNLPEAVYGLADETAGGQIRFHAKFKQLTLQVSRMAKPGFYDHVKSPHMADTMKHSFDLYLSKDGKNYIFCDVSKNMGKDPKFYTRKLVEFEEEQEFDVLLNFPCYGGVDKVLIGLDDEAVVSEPIHKFKDDKKVVIYGTSVQQGGCAARPGMARSNILSRWLNREFYNLGFSSSGKAEDEVAEVIATIPNVAALIMSIEGNCPDNEWLDEHLRSFIKIYRKANPTVPVVIMPFTRTGLDEIIPANGERKAQGLEIQKNIVAEFKAQGDNNIYLFEQEGEFEREFAGVSVWHEVTVDGLHYNELGFYWKSKAMYKFLTETLGL